MGHHKHRDAANLHHLNGHTNGKAAVAAPRIRLVSNIKLQNADNTIVLMLGDEIPELGAQLTADNARALIASLQSHLDQLIDDAPRIIIPGQEP